MDYVIDAEQLAAERAGDGVFPLVSNVWELSPLELLHAYKGQSKVEKRFSQLKTDVSRGAGVPMPHGPPGN